MIAHADLRERLIHRQRHFDLAAFGNEFDGIDDQIVQRPSDQLPDAGVFLLMRGLSLGEQASHRFTVASGDAVLVVVAKITNLPLAAHHDIANHRRVARK